MESEEWTLNKSLIETSGTVPPPPGAANKRKPLSASIPPGFPYFHVSWHDGGFVHVIDNEETFPRSFGKALHVGRCSLDHNCCVFGLERHGHRQGNVGSAT